MPKRKERHTAAKASIAAFLITHVNNLCEAVCIQEKVILYFRVGIKSA